MNESRLTRSFRVSRSSKYLVIPHLASPLTSLCLSIIRLNPVTGASSQLALGVPVKTSYRRHMGQSSIHWSVTSLTSFGRNNLQVLGCAKSFHPRDLQNSLARLNHPQGQRRNVFGAGDELKVAPEGVDKHHPLVPFF